MSYQLLSLLTPDQIADKTDNAEGLITDDGSPLARDDDIGNL